MIRVLSLNTVRKVMRMSNLNCFGTYPALARTRIIKKDVDVLCDYSKKTYQSSCNSHISNGFTFMNAYICAVKKSQSGNILVVHIRICQYYLLYAWLRHRISTSRDVDYVYLRVLRYFSIGSLSVTLSHICICGRLLLYYKLSGPMRHAQVRYKSY